MNLSTTREKLIIRKTFHNGGNKPNIDKKIAVFFMSGVSLLVQHLNKPLTREINLSTTRKK